VLGRGALRRPPVRYRDRLARRRITTGVTWGERGAATAAFEYSRAAGASVYAGIGKLWRLVEDLGFTYPVNSDFNTSRHYPAGLFPNILPAF